MENVIYIIDSGKGETYNKISSCTLPQIYKYANKTHSDVVIISDEFISICVILSRAKIKHNFI